jgi:hypothetical protein
MEARVRGEIRPMGAKRHQFRAINMEINRFMGRAGVRSTNSLRKLRALGN